MASMVKMRKWLAFRFGVHKINCPAMYMSKSGLDCQTNADSNCYTKHRWQ